MSEPTDTATHYHDDTVPRCLCGSTIQGDMCMRTGLLRDTQDIDYIMHIYDESWNNHG